MRSHAGLTLSVSAFLLMYPGKKNYHPWMYPPLIEKRSSTVWFSSSLALLIVLPLSADKLYRWGGIVAEFTYCLLRVQERTCLRHHAEGSHFSSLFTNIIVVETRDNGYYSSFCLHNKSQKAPILNRKHFKSHKYL